MRIAQRIDSTPGLRVRGWLAVALCLVAGFAQGQPLSPLRLQVSIKSNSDEEPIAWRGDLAVAEGRLEKLQPLNLDPNAAAALSISDRRLRVRHGRPLSRDVFNVTALRSPGGELLITPRDAGGQPGEPVRVALDAVLSSPQAVSVGRGDTLFTIARVANDRMRIESDRQSLLFEPGEEFTFELLAEPAGVERGRPYDLTASLVRGRSGEEVWRGATTRVEAPAIGAVRAPIAIPLPEMEGVYTVRLAATRPPGFLSRFPRGGTPPVIAERTFQVAVLDPDRRPAAPTAWNETHAFEPGAASWVRRVPEWMRWRRLPWPQAGPLSSEEGAPPETISPRAAEGACHWRAYPLPIEAPGALYAVEVQYEGEPDEALTMALVEPDALGDLRPIGRAVTRPARRWNRSAGTVVMQLTARPRTTAPMLVLANPSETVAVRFGRIRLLRAAEGPTDPPAEDRLVALDWSEGDLPHALGASHAVSPIGHFEQPDLQTHYETAVALADRVQTAGANAAVITVNERGGAIHPSEVWTTPRFDLGAWADGAGDLPRRELLTLIAQEFRRRGLRIVLGLRFDEAVPALEATDPPAIYAPTHPKALAAQEAALTEALEAVGDPGVLGGVAVRVGVNGWELLGRTGGLTEGAALSDSLRIGYRRLSESLERRLHNAPPLLLMTGELAENASPSAPLTPRLAGASPAASEYLAQLGLHALAADPFVRLVTPWGGRVGFTAAPRSANSARLETLREGLPPTGAPAALSIRADRHTLRLHRSAERLRASNNSKPPSDLLLDAWIADPITESELLAEAVGRSTTVVVLNGPATAGWRDESAGQRRADLTRTPAPPTVREPSELSGGDIGAVAFDTAAESSIALATNRTPWPRRARLTLATPSRMRGERLNDPTPAGGEWFEPGQYPVELTLAPHQTIGWRFSSPGVQVVGLRIEPSEGAEEELTAAVADLQSRDTTTRRPFEALPNASFEDRNESEAGGPFVGWSASRGVSHDDAAAFAGDSSARLASAPGAPSVLTSDPFPMPTTGQLVLGFRVLPGALGPDAELRIELEQIDGGYRNGTRLLASQLVPAGGEGEPSDWLPPIVFPIDDLPLLSDGELRLRLTLTGEGELNLDDLQAEDLILPLDGYGSIELRAEKFALIRLLSATDELQAEGRLGACRELLDGYWARFLVDYFPPHQPETTLAVEEESAAETAEESPAEQAEAPSVSQRLKGYLPRWWR